MLGTTWLALADDRYKILPIVSAAFTVIVVALGWFGLRAQKREAEKHRLLQEEAARSAMQAARGSLVDLLVDTEPPRLLETLGWGESHAAEWYHTALEGWDAASKEKWVDLIVPGTRIDIFPDTQTPPRADTFYVKERATEVPDEATTAPSRSETSDAATVAPDPAEFGRDLAEMASAAVAAALKAVENQTPRLSIWLSLGYVLVLGSAIGGFGSWLLLTATDDVAKGVGGALMGAAAAFILRDLHQIARPR